ncbi:MAG: hypothetical protein A3J49_13150 [Gallionellales bacterium RIFCSPHIGHO2_02_FULL_57_16]|nr:MAG: hypothetical protein A3J49_13150 [Gallionellales bacterium RIFCSPHIGHO2_02_FULL_57_16]
MANWTISDSDLNNQLNRAKAAGAEALKNEPRAKSARYSPARRQVIVELTNGCSFIFPVDKAQGLAGASNKDLAAIKILGKGIGLHWEKLDADLSIASLVVGIFGSHAWMREIARRGGAASTPAKAAAARANGAKGGRPKRAQPLRRKPPDSARI